MNDLSPIAADQAAPPSPVHRPDAPGAIIAAAQQLLPHLERGQRVDAAILRAAMEAAFGASDASGAWDWKTAYDACEAATVLFLRKYGKALFRKADSPALRLSALTKIAGLLPTHTRRSAESEAFQQFSTPTPLGFAALTAAAIGPADRVLEPSAGTGLLAILAEIAGGALVLNELAETRSALLTSLFPAVAVTRFDAAQIDDHLDPAVVPSVVLMNPPFSAMANVAGRMADTAYRHIASALARLADGGRLVAITGANFGPDTPAWRDAFVRLQERGRIVFTAAIDGAVYAKHGTTHRHAADRHRQGARREPGRAAGIAGHRARRRDLAGLDRRARSGASGARAEPRHPRVGRRRTADGARLSRPRRCGAAGQAVRRRSGGGRSRL